VEVWFIIVKQIRVKKRLRSGKIVDVTGDELKEFRAMFIAIQNKPVDFAIIIPEDVEAYIFEAVETEIEDKNRVTKYENCNR
jgi:hypothetical protein